MVFIPGVVQQVEINHFGLYSNQQWCENLPVADHYWQALLLASRGQIEEAKQIAYAIKFNQPLQPAYAWKESSPKCIDDFFDKCLISEISKQPQFLSSLGLIESIGLTEQNAYLNDLSIKALRQMCEEKKVNYTAMQTYAGNELSEEQKISYAIFNWKWAHEISGEKFLFHEYRLSQTFVGVLAELVATFTQFHQDAAVQDLDHYLFRLARIPKQLEQTIEVMEFQQSQKIFPPKFALEKVLKLLSLYIDVEIVDNPFYAALAKQLTNVEMFFKEQRLQLARQILEELVVPAFRNLQVYCQNLLAMTHTEHGVWALPDGDDYYAYLLKAHTTSDLTADQVHALGLCEIERIEQEMHLLLIREGYAADPKNIGLCMQSLLASPDFYYADSSAGRQACLADFHTILKRSREELWPLFGRTPKTPVSIIAVPKHEEEGMPAAYYQFPSLDNSRPGNFYINLRAMRELCKCRMETLAVHEAEPGHHFQLSLQMESMLPLLRKITHFTSYAEGWALYAEKLAYEHGFYSSIGQQLGHLQDELLRAVRLVVDTGIHKKRWSREEAIRYMEEKLGAKTEAIVSEVERYFVAPGQACAYKIGQLKILELRQRVREAMQETFDIKAFHDLILQCGSVPLTVLEQIVDQYIMTHAPLH